jgi:hypothetical protein
MAVRLVARTEALDGFAFIGFLQASSVLPGACLGITQWEKAAKFARGLRALLFT